MSFPKNPHAVIEITKEVIDPKTKKVNSELVAIWDSWEHPRLFKSVNVELITGGLSQATWTVFDPKFILINSVTENNHVKTFAFRVYLGFGADLGEPVFKGILANIERDRSDTTFTVYDMGFRMKQSVKAGYHNKKHDLAILKLVAERNSLQFSPPEKPLKLEPHKAMMQDEQTDWEHAMERARDSGLLLFVREEILFARYPAKITAPKLILENRKADSFSDFNLTFRTPENEGVRPRIVKLRQRGKGGRRIEGQSSESSDGRESIVLKRMSAGKSKSDLTKRAQAQKELDREHAFEGNISFPFTYPDVRLDVRDTIKVVGIGDLFSREYICDTVRYEFNAGQMSVDVDLYGLYSNTV